MGRWYIRRLADGRWQVLSPAFVQATGSLATQEQAFGVACLMVGDEGGGEVAVLDTRGEPCCVHQVPPSAVPYGRHPRISTNR